MDQIAAEAASKTFDYLDTSVGPWKHVFGYRPFNIELDRSEGVFLYDVDGNRYFDASGGPMACNIGHGDPRHKSRVQAQMEKFAFAHPILANRIRAELCEAIAGVLPGTMNHVYLVNSGSEAVDTAIKLARQYHVQSGSPQKHAIISFNDSYHGMTLGGLSASGNPGTRQAFDPLLQKWPHIDQYSDVGRPASMSRDDWGVVCAARVEHAINYAGPTTVAAFISTPHMAGSDYGVVPPLTYWQEIRRICDKYDVLMIADEVVTGFGRTGRWTAMEHFGVLPDISTFAKGLASVYVPLGAVALTDKVAAAFQKMGFLHGFTTGGHGLASAAGLATIEILKEDKLVERTAALSPHFFSHRDSLLAHPTVADVRGWGLFMVLELVKDKATRNYFDVDVPAEFMLQTIALKNGLALYSSLYGVRRPGMKGRGLPVNLAPPLPITADQIDDMMARLNLTLTEWEVALGVK